MRRAATLTVKHRYPTRMKDEGARSDNSPEQGTIDRQRERQRLLELLKQKREEREREQ